MPPRSPEPLRKILLNLFEADCAWMERYYGHGWTEKVREMVRTHRKKATGITVGEIELIFKDELEEDHG